jgi:hypothetical protein
MMSESLYGPRALWKRFGEIAAELGMSKSALGVFVISEWIKGYEAAKKRQKKKKR